jgi:NCS1 family nucleobase:cation symporter-1
MTILYRMERRSMEATEAIDTLTRSGAIEGYAIEPIPDRLKTVRWPDLFLLVSNFLINPSTILIGGLAVASGL